MREWIGHVHCAFVPIHTTSEALEPTGRFYDLSKAGIPLFVIDSPGDKHCIADALSRNPRFAAEQSGAERSVVDQVYSLCRKCHDGENDPKFDLYTYMPKVYHSNLKVAGLPPGAK